MWGNFDGYTQEICLLLKKHDKCASNGKFHKNFLLKRT